MNTTALIADDEEVPRAQLLSALQTAWPELRVVAEAANGIDAWDAFLDHEPQVCVLDVRRPGLTGIEVAQRIGAQSHVVFVAAPRDHALVAFDAGAVDHVLKPVDVERLSPVVARVRARLHDEPPSKGVDIHEVLDRLSGQMRRPVRLDVIPAAVGREPQPIRVDDVIYFESDARYTRVVHSDGEVMIRTPLKELLSQLDPTRFWQIHRGVIVNHRHIDRTVRLPDGSMTLTLRGRTEKLPVARHFHVLFEGD